MNKTIFDLYSDYLLSSFGQVTATGLARLLDGDLSHDQVTSQIADPDRDHPDQSCGGVLAGLCEIGDVESADQEKPL